jgi:hypothetical protein
MKNEIQESIERTNFDGSWEDDCSFCGKKQKEHRKVHGPVNGVTYEHRLPCEPERKIFQQKHRRIVRAGNWIVTGIDLATYAVSKIPFLEETKLAKRILKRHLGYKLSRQNRNTNDVNQTS